MRTGRSNSSTNGSSRVRMPLCPSSSAFQVLSASVARAVVMANPVTTTSGRPFPVLTPAITAPEDPSQLVTPEREGNIVSTEAERVVDGVLVVAVSRLARDDIEIDLGVGRLVVE